MGGSGQQQVCPKVVSGNLHAAGHGNQENYQKKSLKGDNLAYVPEKGTKKKTSTIVNTLKPSTIGKTQPPTLL